ncbi:MAG: DUF4920 domain-containing protein [Gammaproteobacteria bacterium]|nr:DUF4920 domain-containing protein [Gammaproteobacteria bacterium]NNF49286.1 DUF4920 domain-containing protein [Woeseiaceae bacterium]MBT8094820.1 DUF4920 domain-containing protein [Gammaproteobacteria bacterium]MBT8105004.1 DUF4920 domain-containing protein [Gammaproteobacteria bacterium]NNK25018.1 DUF4920 domain-containing protein [Woeseiaceae bacterium]
MTTRCLIAIATMSGLLVSGAGLAADQEKVIRLSEPVEQTAEYETFGSPLDDAVPAVDLEQVTASGEELVGKTVRVVTRVSEVCAKKGCFFIAQEGDSVVRVSFKDYGFFVPTDISGKLVTLVGEVVVKEVTVEQAAHYAEDLGDAATAFKPGKTFEIVATAVRVPRTSS